MCKVFMEASDLHIGRSLSAAEPGFGACMAGEAAASVTDCGSSYRGDEGGSRRSVSTTHQIRASGLLSRKDVSVAVWQPNRGMAEVVVRRGKMWNTTGIIREGKLFCHVEEAVWLVERGSLVLMVGQDLMPTVRLYSLLADMSYGCSWGAYQCYAYLKRLGYVVGRHDVVWTRKSERRLNKHLEPCGNQQANGGNHDSASSTVQLMSLLDVKEQDPEDEASTDEIYVLGDVGSDEAGEHEVPTNVLLSSLPVPRCDYGAPLASPVEGDGEKLDELVGAESLKCHADRVQQTSQLVLMYDVHLPNSKFRKTEPGRPAFSLCITSDRPPELREVEDLERGNHGVPVKFACIECGHVTVCSFEGIQLPFLP